jgi:hypothetical protein
MPSYASAPPCPGHGCAAPSPAHAPTGAAPPGWAHATRRPCRSALTRPHAHAAQPAQEFGESCTRCTQSITGMHFSGCCTHAEASRPSSTPTQRSLQEHKKHSCTQDSTRVGCSCRSALTRPHVHAAQPADTVGTLRLYIVTHNTCSCIAPDTEARGASLVCTHHSLQESARLDTAQSTAFMHCSGCSCCRGVHQLHWLQAQVVASCVA